MPLSLTLRQLEYFVAAARAQSMVGAASTLHVSPAAVSLGISHLEQALKTQLFLRVRHQPLALTAAGRDLLVDAVTAIARVEEFQAKAGDRQSEVTGVIYIGCFTTLAPIALPRLVTEMATRHPSLRIEAEEGTLEQLQSRVLDGSNEIALVYGLDLRPEIRAELVAEIRPYVVLPAKHRLAGRSEIHLRDLASEPMILLDAPPSRHHALSVLASVGVTPLVARVTLNFETLRSFVARGHGWGFLVQRPKVDVSYEGLPISVVAIADNVEPVPIVVASAAGANLSQRASACITVWRSILSPR